MLPLSPRRPARLWPGAFAGLLLAALAAPAQDFGDSVQTVHVGRQYFFLPFNVDPGDQGRIQGLRLYARENNGPWQQVADAGPTARGFDFKTTRDARYTFAVMGVYANNSTQPASTDLLKPTLNVVIDTQLPKVVLRPTLSTGGVAGVTWEVTDEYLDLRSFSLEYRWPNQPEFLPLEADPIAVGGKSWRLQPGQRMEVRLRVKDQAGNLGEQTTVISLAGLDGRPSDYGTPPPGGAAADPGGRPANQPPIYHLNTKKISLDLKIARKGISGVSTIDLWYTTNLAQGYQKAPNPVAQPAEPDSEKWTLTFEADKEGLYGFYMVAHSGVGLSEDAPTKNHQPRVWVEVDLTRPTVKVDRINLIHKPEGSYLDITWKADDKNIAPRPIDIEYSETKDGPWMEVGRGLDNTSRYTWPVPDKKPFKFYVKVRAVDRAGNVGEEVYKELVTVDPVKPQVEIGEVKPVEPKQ